MSADLVLTLYNQIHADELLYLRKRSNNQLTATHTFTVDDNVYLAFKAINVGDEVAPRSFYEVSVDGNILHFVTNHYGDIAPYTTGEHGEWRARSELDLGKFGVGEHTITFTLDSNNDVTEGEAGEANNIYTTTFTVVQGGGQGGGQEEQGGGEEQGSDDMY